MLITRSGYKRKAYVRKSYIRKDGTRVKRSLVKATKVPRTKVKSLYGGPKVPKRRRVLPKLKRGALKGYKYHVKDNQTKRRRAIARMMKHKGGLKTLRHLVVLRSYNKRSKYYPRLNKDVKYAQKLYTSKK